VNSKSNFSDNLIIGSGCVKITPAHSTTDYEVGLKHKLPIRNILDEEGRLKNVPEKYMVRLNFI
jgi:valyl-tRNA synthetase